MVLRCCHVKPLAIGSKLAPFTVDGIRACFRLGFCLPRAAASSQPATTSVATLVSWFSEPLFWPLRVSTPCRRLLLVVVGRYLRLEAITLALVPLPAV